MYGMPISVTSSSMHRGLKSLSHHHFCSRFLSTLCYTTIDRFWPYLLSTWSFRSLVITLCILDTYFSPIWVFMVHILSLCWSLHQKNNHKAGQSNLLRNYTRTRLFRRLMTTSHPDLDPLNYKQHSPLSIANIIFCVSNYSENKLIQN